MSKLLIVSFFNQIILCIFTIILKPFFFFNKKEIWFFSDRAYGIDNAYYQFKYSIKNNKNIISIYLCENKKDAQFKNFENNKNIVYKFSIKHFWYFIHSSKIIFSYDTYPFYFSSFGIYFKRLLKPKSKLIFLQHGVIDSIIPTFNKSNTNFDLFITSGIQEKKCIKKWSGYDKQLVVTGLSRFDNLLDNINKEENIILFMPTWDNKLLGLTKKQFKETNYYKQINNFLNSNNLKNILKNHGYKLLYITHKQIDHFNKLFNIKNSDIIIKKSHLLHFPNIIKKSKILITDYSSISFDFGYLKKPIIYWQFNKYQYKTTCFNYEENGFGKVTKSIQNTINELKKVINSKTVYEKKYSNNINNFFKYTDRINCERINKKIEKI